MLLSPMFLRRAAEVNDRVRRMLAAMSLDCIKASSQSDQPLSALFTALLFSLQVNAPAPPALRACDFYLALVCSLSDCTPKEVSQ